MMVGAPATSPIRRTYSQHATMQTRFGRIALVNVKPDLDAATSELKVRRRRLSAGSRSWLDNSWTWQIIPWAAVGILLLATALLTLVFTAQINDSYPYVLWPWLQSFLFSLIYAVAVQDSLIVTLYALCDLASVRRRHRSGATATGGSSAFLVTVATHHKASGIADPERGHPSRTLFAT